jgi:hypothetical protein
LTFQVAIFKEMFCGRLTVTGTPTWTRTIAGFSHRPTGLLARAEAAICVGPTSRTFHVYDDVKTMLSAAKCVPFVGPEVKLIDSGPEREAFPRDNFITLADLDLSVAFAVAGQLNSDFPGTNPLSFNNRIWTHIQVLNPYTIAPPARAAPAFGSRRFRDQA